MIKVYGIRNCDTIKKTLAWLQLHGHDSEFHDYKKHGVSRELAEIFIEKFGVERLINRNGSTWRGLPDASKLDLTHESVITLLCSQPSVIKRPIINQGAAWTIGFDENLLRTFLKS